VNVKKFFAVVAFICLAWVTPGFCHPHVFVDATIQVMFNKSGFSSIKNHWVYDELYSSAMISSGDKNGDGKISAEESPWFQRVILEELAGNNYFNYVQCGKDFLRAEKIQNFRASVQDGRLALDFEVVFNQPVSKDYTMLVVVVADPTNYILVTSDMEKSGADGPDEIDVEFFNDGLDGLTLFRAFLPSTQGLFLRYKIAGNT